MKVFIRINNTCSKDVPLIFFQRFLKVADLILYLFLQLRNRCLYIGKIILQKSIPTALASFL